MDVRVEMSGSGQDKIWSVRVDGAFIWSHATILGAWPSAQGLIGLLITVQEAQERERAAQLDDEVIARYAEMPEQERGFHDFSGSTVYALAREVQELRRFVKVKDDDGVIRVEVKGCDCLGLSHQPDCPHWVLPI